MRVLLVEDDAKIADFVRKGLTQEGHVVDLASDGKAGLALALGVEALDVIIVDVMLPGRDGLSLIREVRRRDLATPIIVVSARDAVEDRVAGLEAGADDYLTKPFSFAELHARLQALTRRANRQAPATELTYADLTLDLRTRRVSRGDDVIDLSGKEFTLLEFLLRNAERVLSKTMILEHVWDYAFDPQTNVVDVLVCRVRNKVDRDYDPKLIHTIRGVGYVLRAEG
ncbi:MAG: response regulator transcription factor [Myxococcales bacterium]|nr:response regulator transcription factor [Myxococcales bacterium]